MQRENNSDDKIVDYLSVNSSALIQRSGLNGFEIVSCDLADASVKQIKVCNLTVLKNTANPFGQTFHYGVTAPSLAFLLKTVINPRSEIVFLGSRYDVQIFEMMKSAGYDVTFVADKNVKLLKSKIKKHYQADLLVIGRFLNMSEQERQEIISFYASKGVPIITTSKDDFDAGSSYAILPDGQGILDSFLEILNYYKYTEIIKTSVGVCSGVVVKNPETPPYGLIDIKSFSYKSAVKGLKNACNR